MAVGIFLRTLFGVCDRRGLVREDDRDAEIVAVRQPWRGDDQRPPIATRGRELAFHTERAGAKRLGSRQHDGGAAALR